MADDATWPVVVAAGAVVGACIIYRLKVAAQPLRLEMAERGEFLISSNKLNSRGVLFVNSLLNTAFNYRIQLVIMFFMMPIAAVMRVFSRSTPEKEANHFGINDVATQAEFSRINNLHTIIILANHPIMGPIIAIWAIFLISLCGLVKVVIKGVLPDGMGSDFILEAADRTYQLSSRIRTHSPWNHATN